MDFHAVADIFPLMSDTEFDSLCADIAENGLHDPIWIYREKIIDGRNRFLACESTGVAPRFREYEGDESKLVAFVVSLNLHRRHLSESQRAMVAARIANMRRGYQESNPSIEGLVSQTQAAELLNVSTSSVERAAKVQNYGIPELIEQVETGEISVSQAAQIAALPRSKQKRIIRRGRTAGQKALNRLRIDSLKKMQKTGSGCLGCSPDAQATKENVSAFMQMLAKRHPFFRTYFLSVSDELEELELSDEAIAARKKITAAISIGLQTRAEILQKTKISGELFDHTIAVMLDYNEIYTIEQGGKTDGARGARKTLYKLPGFEFENPDSEEDSVDL